jgi:H+/Cl- antiporter ClcA
MQKTNAKKEYLFLLLGAVITAVSCGGVGALFAHTLKFANGVFGQYNWLVYILPLGGLLTVLLFKVLKVEKQNIHTVFSAVKNGGKSPFLLSVAVFVGTAITQFLGGSAGKEGAALQIGSGIASPIANALKLKDEKLKILLLCGMTAMFSSVFTVPLTALAFGLEIIYISRKFYLKAVLPLTVSSFGAFMVAKLLGVHPERFGLPTLPKFNAISVLKVIALIVACSVVTMLFCLALHFVSDLFKKLFKNAYLRIVVGGVLIISLTLLVGNNDYNGGGMHIIGNVLKTGTVCYLAFAFKIIFTAITNAAGFKGGEIVPALFVGATLGAAVGTLLGISPTFSAAVGMVVLFGGATKCTVAAFMLGLEFFGIGGAGYFALAAVLSRILTFNIGLYTEKKTKKRLD